MTDLLRDFSDFIEDLADRDPFDPVIVRLPAIDAQLSNLLGKLRDRIDAFRTAQRNARTWRASAQLAPQFVHRVSPSAPLAPLASLTQQPANLDTSWTVVRARRPRESARRSPSAHQPHISVPRTLPPQQRARECDIPVSASMSLRAIEVASIAEIRTDGALYYLPHARRFAMRFSGGLILQGNIGIVYTSDPSPQKIHDCDAQLSCNIAICRYYHNPAIYPGSVDVRNFAATSWLYRPSSGVAGVDARTPQTSTFMGSTSSFARGQPKKARKLASRDRLDADILTITPDDLAYYNEQLMHDILCGLIMNYYVRSERASLSSF